MDHILRPVAPESVQPWRATGGSPRPDRIAALTIPPGELPAFRRTSGWGFRARHHWRYIGVFDEQSSVVVGDVGVGRMRQTFWAMWDRSDGALLGRTSALRHRVVVDGPRARVRDGSVSVDIEVTESDGVEVVCPSGELYGWTRKQAGIPAVVSVTRDGRTRRLSSLAVIDDTDGYHARRLSWRWSIGVGTTDDGRAVAWNLVTGINDPVVDSERTVWVDGVPHEIGPVAFTPGLDQVTFAEGGSLVAALGPVRVADDNRLLVRSRYRQPFADFSGTLPGVGRLASGRGVMESHDVVW